MPDLNHEPRVRRAIWSLAVARGPAKTLCPSEAARAISNAGEDAWRAALPAVREAAADLAREGRLEVCQRGKAIDSATSVAEWPGGPVRLRLPAALWLPAPAGCAMPPEARAWLAADQRLRPLLERCAVKPRPAGRTVLDALVRAVVYQQLAGAAAATIHGRLLAALPGGRVTPRALAAADDAALRGAGLSAGKLAAVRALQEAADRGDLSATSLRRLNDAATIERLSAIRGVGPWTAEMLMIFTLGREDVFPLDDLIVRRRAWRVLGRPEPQRFARAERAELLAATEPWRPFRSWASRLMWAWSDSR